MHIPNSQTVNSKINILKHWTSSGRNETNTMSDPVRYSELKNYVHKKKYSH